MSLANYIGVVGVGLFLLALGWIIADLQIRVNALERRINNHRGPVQ